VSRLNDSVLVNFQHQAKELQDSFWPSNVKQQMKKNICILDCSNHESSHDFDEGSVVKNMFTQVSNEINVDCYYIRNNNNWPSNSNNVNDIVAHIQSNYDLTVITGSEDCVLEDDKHSYITPLLRIIQSIAQNDQKLLGICFGAQAISRALYGKEAVKQLTPEYGFVRMTGSFETDSSDPISRIFQSMMVKEHTESENSGLILTVCHSDYIQWDHLRNNDEFPIQLICSSDLCPVHAYKLKNKTLVLAVQFHPEFPLQVSQSLFDLLTKDTPAHVHGKNEIDAESIDHARIQFAKGIINLL
jgi:GMP synthase-like glutamine amidotransferase